ncbi:peptidase [Frankia sp. AgB1.9]|uniref:peptidase n=1 Tax=unclassified Frankia TaxID=2632575 RepID=UPI0019329F9D|nr:MULTISPECIES: peptidase [unclassified Frankia]MBL7553081.1 peptidase [Frankia sp. AgB1.9]
MPAVLAASPAAAAGTTRPGGGPVAGTPAVPPAGRPAATATAVDTLAPAPAATTPVSIRPVAPPRRGPGGVGVRLLDAPTDRADDPRAHVYIVDHLAPGATIVRHVEVSNTTIAPQRVSMYAAGARVDEDGFDVEAGRTGDELTSWVQVVPGVVELPARTAATVTVTVAVPRRATAGERFGVVWAEPVPPALPGQVTVVNRVGVRLYLDIGPGGEPPTDFAISNVAAGRGVDGGLYVAATVRNTAERALDMLGSLRLVNGPAGLTTPVVAVPSGRTIGKGESARLVIPVTASLPLGPWTAHLELSSGLVHHTATVRLLFPASPGEHPGLRLGPSVLLVVVSAGGGAVVVLAGFVLVARRGRRRRRRRGSHRA